jgi:hypothetical protein
VAVAALETINFLVELQAIKLIATKDAINEINKVFLPSFPIFFMNK